MAFVKIENLDELIRDSIGGTVTEQTVTLLLPPGENYASKMYKVDFKSSTILRSNVNDGWQNRPILEKDTTFGWCDFRISDFSFKFQIGNDGWQNSPILEKWKRTLHLVTKDGKEETYHAVAKYTPPNKITQEIFQTEVTFKSEISWYTTVIPTIQKFQRERGVPESDFFQKLFGASMSLDPRSEVVDGVILSQNLKYLGYDNVDRHTGFDLRTSKTIIRDLASFHAVPLAIKLQNPNLFQKNIKPHLPGLEFPEETTLDQRHNLIEAFEQIPDCKPILDRIRQHLNHHKSLNNHAPHEPWATVSHNDFWINNIMIKNDDDPRVMILDLQVSTYGSPAADLVFFLLTSVNLDLLDDHFDELVKLYYENFTRTLNRLDVTGAFSYEDFLQEVDFEAGGGQLFHALAHCLIIFSEKGISSFSFADEDFEVKKKQVNMKIPITERHKKRFRWVSMEAVKRNWI